MNKSTLIDFLVKFDPSIKASYIDYLTVEKLQKIKKLAESGEVNRFSERRGNLTCYKKGCRTELYAEDLMPVDYWNERKCNKCQMSITNEGHDPCIANLPGVKFACCGHGVREDSYITFDNGITIRGFVVDDFEFDEKLHKFTSKIHAGKDYMEICHI